ncbi:MAG: MqnA/MqnD/SBP family protein [Candidatus Methylacidiphilales bacterium]
MINLTLGHSPDPDDAFMFYALAEHRIETGPYRFQHILQDIQTLNERAHREELDITAVSIHAFAHLTDRYALLASGASMGDNYGPMLVGSRAYTQEELCQVRIAIPGKLTSAFLALQLFLERNAENLQLVVVPFDEIFSALERGEADVGLLIHEGQLTWHQHGLVLSRDLGQWWFEETGGLPLPLGGNVIRKSFSPSMKHEIADLLKASIQYGLDHRRDAVLHSLPLGRGLDEAAADRFIGMYVNDLTVDYGERGRRAVREFLHRGHLAGLIPPVELEFVG